MRPASAQQGCPRDIGGLFAHLRYTPEYHIINYFRRQTSAPEQSLKHNRTQMVGPNTAQRPAKLADGRARGLDNDYVLHIALARSPEPGTF